MSKVAIIGSGIGGLLAANLLLGKGHRVTVFEAHRAPGGYTGGFRRNGFYFESGTLSFESSPLVFKAMREIGVYDRIPFVPQKLRLVTEKLDVTTESLSGYKEAVLAAYPEEKERIQAYFTEVERMSAAMMLAMGGPKTLGALLGFPLAMARLGLLYRKYRRVPISSFTAGYFGRDSALYRLFKNFGYPEMSAWILGGAFLTLFHDYWTVKSGMQSWADVLVDNLRRLGGEILLGAPVDRIVTRQGRAVALSCQGRTHESDYVISAADYKKTFLQLLDDKRLVGAREMERIEAAAVSEGVFTVYLGLKMSNDELRKAMKLPGVLCGEEEPGVDLFQANDETFFSRTAFSLHSPSLHDPALAPAGKSGLMVQAMCPYRWMDNWGRGDRARYLALKEKAASALKARAGKLIPGLAEAVELEDSATPLTYERYTGNTDGATSAWSWNPARRFYKSSFSTNVRTPIPNLLIGSCWATQIGGVPGAIGAAYACARAIP